MVEPKLMVATHAFVGNGSPSAHQLSFDSDALLRVVPASEANGWVWGSNIVTRLEGYIPIAYLVTAEDRKANLKMCEEIVWHAVDTALLKAVDELRCVPSLVPSLDRVRMPSRLCAAERVPLLRRPRPLNLKRPPSFSPLTVLRRMEVILAASELAVGVGRVPSLAVRLLSQRYVQSAATAASLLQVAAQLHGTGSLVERAGDELERHSREKLEKELEQQRSSRAAKQWPHSSERRRSPAPPSASPISRPRTLRRQTTQQTLEEIAAAHGAPSVDDPDFLEKYEKTQADLTTTFEAAAAAPPPTGSLALRRAASHSEGRGQSPSGSAASPRPVAKEWPYTVRGMRSGDAAASSELVPRIAENDRLVEAQVARQRAHAERKEAIRRRQQRTGAGAASRVAETPSLGHGYSRGESPLSSSAVMRGWGGGRSSASSRSAPPPPGARTAQPRCATRPAATGCAHTHAYSVLTSSRPSSLTSCASCRVRAQKRRAPLQPPLSPKGSRAPATADAPGRGRSATAELRTLARRGADADATAIRPIATAALSPPPQPPPPPAAVAATAVTASGLRDETHISAAPAQQPGPAPSAYNRLLSMLDEHETQSHGNNAALLDDLATERAAERAASPSEGGSAPPIVRSSAGISPVPSLGLSPRSAAAAGDNFAKGDSRAPDRRSPRNGAAFEADDAEVETAGGAEDSPRAALQGSTPRGRAALSSFAGLRELTANVPTPPQRPSTGVARGGFSLLTEVTERKAARRRSPPRRREGSPPWRKQSPPRRRRPAAALRAASPPPAAAAAAEDGISPPPLPPQAAVASHPAVRSVARAGVQTPAQVEERLRRFLDFVAS